MSRANESTGEHDDLRRQLAEAENRLADLTTQRSHAESEVQRLSQLLGNRLPGMPATSDPPSRAMSPADKVHLFRSLFRGRTDVYPKLWINSKKGTKGYSPACTNEWVRGICEKPRVKCGECPRQAFPPVDDDAILGHLQGRQVIGVYPMLDDESCWFLAADFDKGEWMEDVAAFVTTCRDHDVPVAVERSRSGNGAHVWFFFAAPVPAATARTMGCYLLTETMSRRHELPLSSYDRLFPNQDTMPRGGFGNLIALPLQRAARQSGNSLFVDEAWQPISDQWAFLAALPRIDPGRVHRLAQEAHDARAIIGARGADATSEDDATPWRRPPSRRVTQPTVTTPLPSQVRAVLAQQLFVEKEGLPSALITEIRRLAAFQNPEFYKKQAMRLSTAMTPRVISCADDTAQHVGLPRGCLGDLRELLGSYDVALSLDDQRAPGAELELTFAGQLDPVQQAAAHDLLAHDIGVLVAPPGSGKTVIGAHLVAARSRNTLVLVHRTQLLDQWRAQLALFLGIDKKAIGAIGSGRRKVTGQVDVAMIQSLVRRGEVNDLVAGYGHVLVDECHHVSAVSFESVMREVEARFVTGLTATPQRRDGHHPILEFHLGPVRHRVHPRGRTEQRELSRRVIMRETAWQAPESQSPPRIQELYGQIARDDDRNRQIIDDVIQALEEGRSPILLTERRDHLELLAEQLGGATKNLIVLRGGMGKKQRRAYQERLASIPTDEERLILATGRFIGEGFDDARLDTLFLTMPVSWKGTLVQYAGRLHRIHSGKTEVRIFDYVDRQVPMLARMFEKRLTGYRSLGYELTSAEYDDITPSSSSEPIIEFDVQADEEL